MTETAQSYEIRTYEEGFEQLQYELGTQVTKDWIGFSQTPAEQLKATYSGENFDSSSKMYAFHEDKLVGFVTTSIPPRPDDAEGPIQGRLEFPIVDPNHFEVSDQLIHAAFDYLKSKNVEEVQSRVSDGWGATGELAQKYGYSFDNVIRKTLERRLGGINVLPSSNIRTYSDNDRPKVVEFMTEVYKMTEAQINTQLGFMENNPQRLVEFFVYEKEGQFWSLIAPIKSPQDEKLALIPIPTVKNNDESIRNEIFDHVLYKLQEHGYEKINIIFFGPTIEIADILLDKGYTQLEQLEMFKRTLR